MSSFEENWMVLRGVAGRGTSLAQPYTEQAWVSGGLRDEEHRPVLFAQAESFHRSAALD